MSRETIFRRTSQRGGSRSRRDSFNAYELTGLSLSDPFNDKKQSRKHPPHLRGREIGLYYAKQSKNRREQREPSDGTPKAILLQSTLIEIHNLLQSYPTRGRDTDRSGGNWKDFQAKFDENLKGNDSACSIAQKDVELGTPFRDTELDQLLLQEASNKNRQEDFQAILEVRKKLPTWDKRAEILQTVQNHQVVVLCGETGCGKTTQVGQFLLDAAISSGRGSGFRAICTQPRRIAATSVAQRVAQERCEPCGGDTSSVGYQIRLERRLPRKRGSILFCTTGILVQYLQSDPYLEDVSHLLLDEVHERDIMIDFLLAVVKDLLPRRPQLKVILMSATINSDIFSQYFNNCPVLVVPGMTHPVQTRYLEDILNDLDFRVRPKHTKSARKQFGNDPLDVEYTRLMVPSIELMETSGSYPFHVLKSLRMRESEESPEDLILQLLKHICTRERGGAILIFFPGWTEISDMHKVLLADRAFSSRKYLILPLHSMLPSFNQRLVFDKPSSGVRKIILSTNIAETSITIDDVVFVIDCGKIKQSDFDSKKNLDKIQMDWVSLANARQRMGRAGRTQPGVCYRLYSRMRESTFIAHPVPEMKRTRLEELILRIKILKLGKVAPFLQRVPEPPEERTVQLSLELLGTLGALDPLERLTPLGFHLAQLPVDPRTAKLILLGAIFGCLEPIVSIAAVLSFKDPFVISIQRKNLVQKRKKELDGGLRSDHLLIARVMKEYRSVMTSSGFPASRNYCNENYLNCNTMSMLKDMVDQLCRDLHERHFLSSPSVSDPTANVNSGNERLIRAVLCAGLFPNIAQVKLKKGRHASDDGADVRHQKRHAPPAKITTVEDGRVTIHPGSVNCDSTHEFQSPWLCYHGKVKTSSLFLYDCSEVSPPALLFFGGSSGVSISKIRGIARVRVAPGIEFDCDSPTSEVLENLRTRWDDYLSYRVSHPGSTDWSVGSPDSSLLRAIIRFVTADMDSPTHLPLLPEAVQRNPISRQGIKPQDDVQDGDDRDDRCSPPDDWDAAATESESSED